MPSGKGKKKGKQKKLTKAEKERLKREEAERKAQEEEEARIRAEQELKEREERERQEQEERRKLEEQERARHQVEIDELSEMIRTNKEKLLNLKKENRAKEKWDRYMLCDGRPDPTSKKELNTYMNLWKEESEFKEFNLVLEECELTLELIEELNKCLAVDEDLTDKQIAVYEESIKEMYELLESKLDEATIWLLKMPGDNINHETANLETVVKSKSFKACIWGNTAKNPRVKAAEFLSQGFTVEIPKSLVLADVAIRLLYRAYDTMSPRCSTYRLKSKEKKPQDPVLVTVVPEEEQADKVNELDRSAAKTPDIPIIETPRTKSGSRKDRKSAGSRSASRKSAGRKSPTGKSPSVKSPSGKSPSRKSTRSKSPRGKSPGRKSASRKNPSRMSAKGSAAERKDEEPKNEDSMDYFDKMDDVDVNILNDEDNEFIDETVVDLRSFSPMGAIAIIELLELPPQQKKANDWLMQQIISPELKRVNMFATNSSLMGKTLNESQHMEQQEGRPIGSAKSSHSSPDTTNISSIKPIAITLKLPDDVMFFEEPQLARWDESCCHWKLDGFEDVTYDEENRTMSFKTVHFGAITMIQDLYLNVPFQSWELRPIDANNCLLSVIAVNIDVEIEIKGSKCCLRKPEENVLAHLIDVWCEPEELIRRMKRSGINIFPAQDGEKYVSICKKDPVFVNSIYEQLALSSSAYAYCWSKWNGVEECPQDTIVVGVVEWCNEDSPSEDDYKLYMASTRICYKLAIGEFDEHFSNEIAENTQMHPDLFHMVQNEQDGVARKRIADNSFTYVDSVYQLIKATNFLIYS